MSNKDEEKKYASEAPVPKKKKLIKLKEKESNEQKEREEKDKDKEENVNDEHIMKKKIRVSFILLLSVCLEGKKEKEIVGFR